MFILLCYVMLCYVMLCYDMLCYVMVFDVILYHACYVMSCRTGAINMIVKLSQLLQLLLLLHTSCDNMNKFLSIGDLSHQISACLFHFGHL